MNFKLLPSKYNIDLLRRINAYLCFNESSTRLYILSHCLKKIIIPL